MTPRFTRLFRVRHYELDALGHVSGVNLVRYMQEAAIEASSALGFGLDWYSQRNVGWVVRRLTTRYLAAANYGDEIEAVTWLSGLRGVRSIREYDLKLRAATAGASRAAGPSGCTWISRPASQPAFRMPGRTPLL